MIASTAQLGALLALAVSLPSSAFGADLQLGAFNHGWGQTKYPEVVDRVKTAMLGSIRTSWEQGTAMHGLTELEYPQYSVFGKAPFAASTYNGELPLSVLQLGVSAVTRQSADGRLSQIVNGDQDGAGLDGASAGVGVWLGSLTDKKRADYFGSAARRQLDYIVNVVPRTESGAISHRAAEKQYWNDAVFMGAPFLAYAGVQTHNSSLVVLAYDQVRLYRDALIKPGPYGPLWAHLKDDVSKEFWDAGLWATGNGWAALGAVHVLAAIQKSEFKTQLAPQAANLTAWAGEIVNGTFLAVNPDGLIPDYIAGNPATFSDAAASSAIAAVYYRLCALAPKQFGARSSPKLHAIADKIRTTILSTVDELGLVTPVVDPLSWAVQGVVSTEGQAFTLMMYSAWRDLNA